jgi:release factor glutamine methyltransferase
MSLATTLATVLLRGTQHLRHSPDADPASARLDAELLLAHALSLSRSQLLTLEDTATPDADALQRYEALLGRRAAGEPLAYILGRREFWSQDLIITPDVLVPRPETELLVERALAVRPSAAGRIVDLGTGSGAIALALATERPQWEVMATDLSGAALAVARANARRLALPRVEFRWGSWYEPLAGQRFDLLLSNPPYVAADDPVLLGATLSREPRTALTPGVDALTCIRVLAHGAPAHLQPGGWLLLEHGAQQGAQVRHELVLAGFTSVRSHRDLAGHERVTEGQHGHI